ncbi:hypothetical protein L1987_87050 [Smallanthus sonchifolius]|nr:hypothetical protein L1987_87050 [Smallanthus sonchifolius]
MRNRLSLMGLTRSSSKKRRKSKGTLTQWESGKKNSEEVEKANKGNYRFGHYEKRSNMKDEDKKIGLNFSDSDDDQTPLSLLLRNKKDLDSEFKEIEDAEKVRENGIGGKVIEREIVATLEVTNNTEAKKAIVVEKEAEGKFGDSSEVRESYEADITKMGKRF